VHYGFNCGSGALLIVSEKTYNDGQWHSVVFSRMHTNGKLIIDNEDIGEGSSKGATKSINILSPYYVGGISPNISNEAKFNIKVRLLPPLPFICMFFIILFTYWSNLIHPPPPPNHHFICMSYFPHCVQCILHISFS
jgi:hypothetical protein